MRTGCAPSAGGTSCADVRFPDHQLGENIARAPDSPKLKEPPHSKGWNYVFCDGHAKWQRVERTWTQLRSRPS